MVQVSSPSHATSVGLSHRTLSGFSHVFLGATSRAAFQLVILGVLSRLLTPAEFGLMAGATLVASLASIVTQLGIGPALTQRAFLETRHVRTGFSLCTVAGVLLSALLWVTAPLFKIVFHNAEVVTVIQSISPVIAIQAASTTAEALLQRSLRFRVLAVLEVASYAIGYGLVGIVLAEAGCGVWSIVWAYIVQHLVRAGGLMLYSPHTKSPLLEWRSIRELLGVSGGFSAGSVASVGAQRTDYLVVAHCFGAAPLGLYERAYQLMMVPERLFVTALARVLFPAMAQVQTTLPSMCKAYRRSLTVIALFVLPTSVVLVTLADETVRVLFGDRWAGSIVTLQVLASGMIFRCGSLLSDTVARAKGAALARAWRQWVYAGTMFGATCAGIPWGMTGVAAGAVAAFASNWLLTTHLSLSLLGLSWREFARAHLPGAMVALVVATLLVPLVGGVRSLEATDRMVLFVAGVLLSSIAFLTIVLRSEKLLGSDGLWMCDLVRAHIAEF